MTRSTDLRSALMEFVERQELFVDEQGRRLGVIERVKNLLGRKADVHGLENRAHHRHSEIAFQIAVAVPIQYADDFARLHAERVEGIGELSKTFVKFAICQPTEIAIDDFLIRMIAHRRQQELLDQQWKSIRRFRRLNFTNVHASSSCRSLIPALRRRSFCLDRVLKTGPRAGFSDRLRPAGAASTPSNWSFRSYRSAESRPEAETALRAKSAQTLSSAADLRTWRR